MSKCREAFSGIYPTIPSGDIYLVWQAAWNAAMQEAAGICKEAYWREGTELANTIEQEQSE